MYPQSRLFPEVAAGGFSRLDGGVSFYGRINAILSQSDVVVDYGAGRGRGLIDDTSTYRRSLRDIKGRCYKLIGLDPDPAVLKNPGLDEAYVIDPEKPLPLEDSSVNIIISDYTFEHIENSMFVAGELSRVLKPGGWICARTPNRWGYIGIATNIIPNRWHESILRRAQPDRKSIDIFPTTYPLNTRSALRKHFPAEQFNHCTYGHFGEPRYFGRSFLLWSIMMVGARFTPEFMAPTWLIFIQKR